MNKVNDHKQLASEECIFCKIVEDKIPATILYQDEDFIVFLDAYPHISGQTLVVPKKHISSSFTEIPDDLLTKGILLAKKISKILVRDLELKRVVQVIEGLAVPHAHIKLFPVRNGMEFGLTNLATTNPVREDMLTPKEISDVINKIKVDIDQLD